MNVNTLQNSYHFVPLTTPQGSGMQVGLTRVGRAVYTALNTKMQQVYLALPKTGEPSETPPAVLMSGVLGTSDFNAFTYQPFNPEGGLLEGSAGVPGTIFSTQA